MMKAARFRLGKWRAARLGVFGLAYCLVAAPVEAAADRSVVEGSISDYWFPVGETIHYKIYWGLIPVADSTAASEWIDHDGQRMLAVRFRTQSNSFLSTIYPVDDLIESIIDPTTFLPVQFTKRLREGGYRCHEVTTFDHVKGQAYLFRPETGDVKQYAIDTDTRDLISFMYSMRTEDFPVGVEQEYQVMADEKVYDLQVKSLKEEPISLPRFGEVPSIKLKPTAAFQGLFVRKGDMTLWVSDDARRLVTKAAIKVPVAHVNLVLDHVTGPGDDRWVQEPAGKPAESSSRVRSRHRQR